MGWNHQLVSVWKEFLLVAETIENLSVSIFYPRNLMYGDNPPYIYPPN